MIVIDEYDPVVVRLAFSEFDTDGTELFKIDKNVLPLVIGKTWKGIGQPPQERTQPDLRMSAVLRISTLYANHSYEKSTT